MDTEIWKDIEGLDGAYKISSLGRCYSYKSNKFIKPVIDKAGYCWLGFYHNGKSIHKLCHRTVAQAFIPNPENKRTINHKNGIKTDNQVDNLEWMTHSENHKHAYNTLGRKHNRLGHLGAKSKSSKIVYQYSLDMEYIRSYYGTHEAGRIVGISFKNISTCCLGGRKSAGGFIWKYARQDNSLERRR